MDSFIFDASKGETPASLRRRREIAEALLASNVGNVPQNVGEGIASIGRALAGRLALNALEKREAAGRVGAYSTVRGAIADALGGKGGGYGFPAAPASSGASGSQSAANPNVGSTIDFARAESAPPAGFSGGKQEFVDMLMPAAIEASQRTGIDPRIIVAQAAQETGWGRSAPGNNYFGIKSHGQGGGQNFTTHEVINGQRVKMQDNFRQFGSPEDSVAGYADFMRKNPRYGPMRQAQGLDAQLAALGASGYATDPNYSASVGAIARNMQMPQQPVQVASLDPSIGITPSTAPTPDPGIGMRPQQAAIPDPGIMMPQQMAGLNVGQATGGPVTPEMMQQQPMGGPQGMM